MIYSLSLIKNELMLKMTTNVNLRDTIVASSSSIVDLLFTDATLLQYCQRKTFYPFQSHQMLQTLVCKRKAYYV
jgi:hypothetical protein